MSGYSTGSPEAHAIRKLRAIDLADCVLKQKRPATGNLFLQNGRWARAASELRIPGAWVGCGRV